ncbi:VP0952 family biofilm-associated protein [Photobacterium leiognathi]|uniref:hypothetical protein n=1 Tax=Photobacterium leiognathi TaxID=553611 RepID=UPI0002088492|nr:hypothetical protein [Photobacterium leiognathi]PSW54419.1 hypothetical protein CTM83_06145 [Photobacterium leiognathi subsp. mandapamensis]GAA03572.1 putative membrane protein [Photobacterium leiognathi subsp. mandapamensis svers.1.1.]
MLYKTMLIAITLLLTVLGVNALAHSQGELPILALAIPALWLLPQGGVAAWLLLIGLGLFGYALPEQPVALSVSLFMMLPILIICTSPKGCWQLGSLMISIVLAMNAGLMALQGEGKLPGSITATLLQIIAIAIIWFAARSWRPVEGNTWWPIILVIPLWVGGMEHAALLALCVTGIIAALQSLSKMHLDEWIPKLACVLPAVGFATLVIMPQFDVANPILVSWLLVLGGGLLGESLLEDPEEEE